MANNKFLEEAGLARLWSHVKKLVDTRAKQIENNVTNLDTRITNLNNKVNGIGTPVLLWSGSHEGYSGDYPLNQNPLNFKKLLIIYYGNGADNSMEMDIIGGAILDKSTGIYMSSKILVLALTGFTLSDNTLHFNHIRWESSSSNGPATIKKIYGIK